MGKRAVAREAARTHRPISAIPLANSLGRRHRRTAAGAATEPSSMPRPHVASTKPRSWGRPPIPFKMKRGSRGERIAAANIAIPVTSMIPRTSGVETLYRTPSTKARQVGDSSRGWRAILTPPSSSAEIPNDAPLNTKADCAPSFAAIKPPTAGPAITAM